MIESPASGPQTPPPRDVPAFFPYRFMAVDTGSNAIKYRVWEIEDDGSVRVLAERRFPVRLGTGTFTTGNLPAAGIAVAVKAFESISQDAQSMCVHGVRAVGTSALREASNRLTLVRQVAKRTGIRLEIIPAAEEARLIALGALGARPQLADPYLIIDIGGGSTEVILARDPDIVAVSSMRLGAVRLNEMFLARHPPRAADLELAERHIHDVLTKVPTLPDSGDAPRCLGGAGTITAIHDIAARQAGRQSVDGELTLPEVSALVERLKTLTNARIESEFKIDPRRGEIILAGAMILRSLMQFLGVTRLEPCHGGVSDGLLQGFLERAGLRRSRLFDYDRTFLNQAIALGEHYHFHRQHAMQVLRLAVSLFEQLAPLHALGPVDLTILKGAALLHEIGQHVSFNAHHKHSYYLILNSDLPGLSETEKLLMACVARYHRKAHPKRLHEGYALLDEADRLRARKLASILRIADALDREHQSLVGEVRVAIHPDRVEFQAAVHFQAAVEIWNAGQKGSLFEEVFGLKPHFTIAPG